jgi:4'-phosphopantetheinyl transferase
MSDACFSGLELWLVDLEAASPALEAIEAATPRLSEADLARLPSGSDTQRRLQARAARIALRILVERAFGPHWRGIDYTYSPTGKPALAGGAAGGFSLSHSGGQALIGLCSEGGIGVDLERQRTISMPEARQKLVVAAGEGFAPGAPLCEDAESRLLQAWVRLEAVAKTDGVGIGRLLGRLGFWSDEARGADGAGTARSNAERLARSAGLKVHDLAAGEDLFAAVAIRGVAGPAAAAPMVRGLPADVSGICGLLR